MSEYRPKRVRGRRIVAESSGPVELPLVPTPIPQIDPDAPFGTKRTGWVFNTHRLDSYGSPCHCVWQVWQTTLSQHTGPDDKSGSRDVTKNLYATRRDALAALMHAYHAQCQEKLCSIADEIAKEPTPCQKT